MRKYNLLSFIGVILLIGVLTSCNDYLKESSDDLLIPKKVDEFASVLQGDGYPNTLTEDIEWMDLMTDDAEVSPSANPNSTQADGDDNVYLPVGRGAFTWAQDIEYYDTSYGKTYLNRYKNIMACNIIIENANTMQGDSMEVNSCVAQAYALRAMSYLYLVNWYGQPYNPATAEKDMGVIIRLKSEMVRDQPQRSTVAQVYAQIISDLDKASALFKKAKKSTNIYLMNEKSVDFLKCRVALYTQNWEDVIKYGSRFTEDGFSLYDISALTKEQMSHQKEYVFLKAKNPEVVFMFGGRLFTRQSYMDNLAFINGAAYAPSQTNAGDLMTSYENGDNRIYAFFCQNNINYDPVLNYYEAYEDYRYLPYKHYSMSEYSQALRTSEILLNMAEAYVQTGKQTEAVELMNLLHKKRFTAASYQALNVSDFSTQEDLLKYVREERRRELCFEETHRWNDLRRYGMPRIEHKFYSAKNSTPETYVLEQGDKNYTLELPQSELGYNQVVERTNRRTIKSE